MIGPRVLVACDKFKGSATAKQVASALATGLRSRHSTLAVTSCAVADGGDGTVEAAIASGYEPIVVGTTDALGRPRRATIAVRDGTAIAEVAAACGASSLPGDRGHPMTASSFGAGLLIRGALNAGASRIILGLGGSASSDGGAGMLQALGVSIRDNTGLEVPPGGAALEKVAVIDTRSLEPRLRDVELIVATDVDNPLLGPEGAAVVYGPQKGADAAEVAALEAALARWAEAATELTSTDLSAAPGTGAAGGTAFGAMAFLGATRRPGAEVVLEILDFKRRLRGAAVVITGEGSLDEQTLRGKTPAAVAAAARGEGVPVLGVAGRCSLDQPALDELGLTAVYELRALEPDEHRCHQRVLALLAQVGAAIAADLEARRVLQGTGRTPLCDQDRR